MRMSSAESKKPSYEGLMDRQVISVLSYNLKNFWCFRLAMLKSWSNACKSHGSEGFEALNSEVIIQKAFVSGIQLIVTLVTKRGIGVLNGLHDEGGSKGRGNQKNIHLNSIVLGALEKVEEFNGLNLLAGDLGERLTNIIQAVARKIQRAILPENLLRGWENIRLVSEDGTVERSEEPDELGEPEARQRLGEVFVCST